MSIFNKAWDYRLDLTQLTDLFDGTNARECGEYVAKQIRDHTELMAKFPDEMEEFAGEFELVDDVDEFDYTLDDLYDFGNEGKILWINAFGW